MKLPVYLRDADAEIAHAFQRYERGLDQDLRRFYDRLFPDLRAQLATLFLQDAGKGKDGPVWDPLKREAVRQWTTEFDAFVDATEEEANTIILDAQDEQFGEGYDRGLWLLALNGITLDDTARPASLPFLAAMAIGGLTAATRLSTWGNVARVKFRQAVDASSVTGATLPETLALIDTATGQLRNAAAALATNEAYLAHTTGQAAALEPYQDQLQGEIWVTRDDEKVCPLCAPLDLTFTEKMPIKDTHPECRCRKLPVALNARGQVVNYRAFLRSIGRS